MALQEAAGRSRGDRRPRVRTIACALAEERTGPSGRPNPPTSSRSFAAVYLVPATGIAAFHERVSGRRPASRCLQLEIRGPGTHPISARADGRPAAVTAPARRSGGRPLTPRRKPKTSLDESLINIIFISVSQHDIK